MPGVDVWQAERVAAVALATFAAEYRVSVDGRGGGWQSLPERVLTWTARHQVQQAQAVLTRP